MSGEKPAAVKTRRGKAATPGERLAAAAEELRAALEAVEGAGLEPMDLLEQVRDPLAVVDDVATRMRELRLQGVTGAYPDRSVPVYRISDASGLSAALVTRYAKQAGLEMRNRRSAGD
ncbi:hypothetical protein [Kitasatospora cineracea]|uniref:Uncharacterized protein n=1 Tax=Kitasatospora cineracea TaxID=88074 RepID=A0A8G1UFC1_9ACTN|nr:hypothetical protein [Kitasatospora cineracea]ROR42916.1 hypothetical protein EDD39_1051 [Kitasatospora cineracea]